MLSYEEGYVAHLITKAGGLPALETSCNDLWHYCNKWDLYYDSKRERIQTWNPDVGELRELTLAVFTLLMLHNTLTYQAIVGMIAGRLSTLDDPIDQVKCAAELVAVISKSGLITITRYGPSRSIMVTTTYRLKTTIPTVDKHMPSLEPPIDVTANKDPHYGSLLLGGSVKFHEGELCLDHINRMNKIKLKLNRNFLGLHEEAPTFPIDTQQKQEQWESFIKGSYNTYLKLANQGNRFWIDHKYCNRGRTYAINYYVSPQGSSFKKAIVQLAKTEIVKM